jgi:hypothetical protein
MNRNRISIAITLSLLLTGVSIPMTNAATKPKTAGRTSSSTANTILNGKGAPLSTEGIDGDFYIDTRSLLIYGPKKSKKWPAPQSLQGPVGASGTDGKNGGEGKTVSSASSVAGPSGAQGVIGEKGEKGETGSAGANGAAGIAGATGAQGATGPTGSSGGGGGTPGATGATGATGAAGSQGVTGLTGIKGETGTAGAIGPSNVYKGTFNFPDISGSPGTSQMTTLSGFKAGKSYLVTISIVTYQPTNNADTALSTGLSISNNLGTAEIWFAYQSLRGLSYRSGADSDRYEHVTLVQLTLNGSSSVDYSINLNLSIGWDTTVRLAKSEASYVATLVGSIGTL